jgi:hypothetical protein
MDPGRRLLLFALLAACGPAKVEIPDPETDDSATPGGDDSSPPSGVDCPAVGASLCGNEASMLRGTISLADGVAQDTRGDLTVALMHEAYGGAKGGGYHTHVVIPSVDLADGPVPFQLDMCASGAMWTEENCTYGLVVVLDQNGNNQGHANLVPDAGEPATRVADLTVSCGGESPCLDVVLDCVDGASCVSFAEQACACSDETCPSDYALCQ